MADDRATLELVQQIRKLHWLGVNKEARQLEAVVSRMPLGESLLLCPRILTSTNLRQALFVRLFNRQRTGGAPCPSLP
jgi:hypothetical protein